MPVNRTFTNDSEINPFGGKTNIKQVTVNGSIILFSDTSLVRLIVEDQLTGEDYLLYETYPLINTGLQNQFSFTSQTEELYAFASLRPVKLKIQVIGASVTITNLGYLTTVFSKPEELNETHRQQVIQQKINNINANIATRKMLWVADIGEYGSLPYMEKKKTFGTKYNLKGYDFYAGGIFSPLLGVVTEVPSTLPPYFDWRNKHNALNHQSPYWDGDPNEHNWGGDYSYIRESNGWMTSVKFQGGPWNRCYQGCYIFAPLGAIEGVANLYFNQHKDFDLSEQAAMTCDNDFIWTCYGGGDPGVTYIYARDSGVVDNGCSPWMDSLTPCNKCNNPVYKVKIAGWNGSSFSGTGSNMELIKQMLMQFGPLGMSHSGHIMVLVGWDQAKVGDTIHVQHGWQPYIIIQPGSDLVGKTYWILKNAYSVYSCDNGYVREFWSNSSYIYKVLTPIIETINDTSTVLCRDADNDGYYNWGIGTKPANCPPCPAQVDFDDSNPLIGPYDPNYWPSINCSAFTYQSTPLQITSNQTWSEIKYINRDIIVKTGKTLTIRDYVFMVQNSKIIVERGAYLVVDGGVITGSCGNTWKGIEVWGDKTKTQYAVYQGKVELKNNAVIEHASFGITTSKKINGATDYNYTGGIILAYNSTFRNNFRDIEFLSYHNINQTIELGNASTINRCIFETDNNVRFTGQLGHVSLYDVNGVRFKGCKFEEKRGNLNVLTSGCTGIGAINAGFWVDEYCSSLPAPEDTTCNGIRSNFINMLYGVKASGLNSANFSVHVVNSDFCSWRGIYLNDVDNAELILNHLNVPVYNVSTSASNYRYGIYLEGCTLYTVEGNQLTSNVHTTPNLVGSSFGIVVKNSMTDDNSVYRNYYQGFGVGCEAIGTNRGMQTSGLSIKCNDYLNGKYDIYIHSDPQYPNNVTGIAPTQQANLFSNGSSILLNNYLNQGTWINYSYCNSVSRTNPQISSGITKIGNLPGYSCPTTLGGGINPGDALAAALQSQQQMQETRVSIEAVTDAGNTEGLVTDVITTDNEEAYKTYCQLMQISPYISKEVLQEVGGQEQGLTAPMIRDVIVANPQGAKDVEVMINLENRLNTLPQYMINQVLNSRNTVSALENLQAIYNNQKSDRDQAVSRYIRYYLKTEDANATNLILDIYSLIDDPAYRLHEAEFYTGLGDYGQAIVHVQQAIDECSPKELEYYSQWSEFYQVYISWLEQGKALGNLDADDINWLKSFGINHPAFNKALTLLNLNNASDYSEPLYLPDETQLKSGMANRKEEMIPVQMAIYPNPASEFITVEYDYPEKAGLQMQITDMTGCAVYTRQLVENRDIILIDVQKLLNGQYLCTLKSGNKVLRSSGLTILH